MTTLFAAAKVNNYLTTQLALGCRRGSEQGTSIEHPHNPG
jgi:hypothetical protein